MAPTKIDEMKAPQSRAQQFSNLPASPSTYYGTPTNDVDSVSWRGGEFVYLTTDNRFYIQTATSGTTATWKRYPLQTTAV